MPYARVVTSTDLFSAKVIPFSLISTKNTTFAEKWTLRMKIGVFDSGYGGLTILKEIRKLLPQYDYIYLGDNARTPYGTRSFEVVYQYSWQCVRRLFEMDCQLIIIACNTASAKALRSIQQNDLVETYPERRVLGVIRPTAESIGNFTKSGKVGILGTTGTVQSQSYDIEIGKLFPEVQVFSQACPMWVPLIENNEHTSDGADYFVRKYIEMIFSKSQEIDTLVLGCTHYPLLEDKIQKAVAGRARVVSQGQIVAESLKDYLHRHPEQEQHCTKGSTVEFYTTESEEKFSEYASIFWKEPIQAKTLSF